MPDASDFPALTPTSQHPPNLPHPSSQTSYASQAQQSAAAAAAASSDGQQMQSPAQGSAQTQNQTPGQTSTLPQPPPHLAHLQQQHHQSQSTMPVPPPGLGGTPIAQNQQVHMGQMTNGETHKEEFPALGGQGKDVSHITYPRSKISSSEADQVTNLHHLFCSQINRSNPQPLHLPT